MIAWMLFELNFALRGWTCLNNWWGGCVMKIIEIWVQQLMIWRDICVIENKFGVSIWRYRVLVTTLLCHLLLCGAFFYLKLWYNLLLQNSLGCLTDFYSWRWEWNDRLNKCGEPFFILKWNITDYYKTLFSVRRILFWGKNMF
jgi:hypothetical protein